MASIMPDVPEEAPAGEDPAEDPALLDAVPGIGSDSGTALDAMPGPDTASGLEPAPDTVQEDVPDHEETGMSLSSSSLGERTYAPDVAEQMRKMYTDMDKVFQSRKEQMDYRETTLDRREAAMDAREHEIDSKLRVLEEKAGQWDLREAQFHAKEMQLSVREETIRAGEESLEKRRQLVDSMEEGKCDPALRGRLLDAEEKLEEQKKAAASIEEKLRLSESNLNEALKKKEDALAKAEEWKVKFQSKDAEKQEIAAALSAMDRKSDKGDSSSEHALRVLEELGMSGSLSDGGITAEMDGISFRIRPDVHMVQAEKCVRRGARYQKKAAEWNQEDETRCFLVYDRKVLCRVSYSDLSGSIGFIMEAFGGLK